MADSTYLQPAQPTTLGYVLAGHLQPVLRNLMRLENAYNWVNRSPAGAGGTTGSSLPLDREHLAAALGFYGVIPHARDAMWQTDGLVDLLATLAGAATEAGQVAADLEIWASPAFGFVALADEYCRVSALMPQKKNPYALAVIRHAGGIQVIAPAADYSARISAKRLRAAVEFPPDFEKTLGDSSSRIPEVKIYHFEGETRSQVAVGNIRRLLGDYRKQLVEARLAAGEHAQLLPDLEQMVADHPLDEQIHAQLMLALYRGGRQADALAAYQRLRRTLDEELGLEPSQSVRDLELAILRQDSSLDAPAPAVTNACVFVKCTGSLSGSRVCKIATRRPASSWIAEISIAISARSGCGRARNRGSDTWPRTTWWISCWRTPVT